MGPYAVGLVKEATGSFAGGLIMLALLLLVAVVATLWLRSSPALAEHPAVASPATSA